MDLEMAAMELVGNSETKLVISLNLANKIDIEME